MSSTRFVISTLKYTGIAGVNATVVAIGLHEHQKQRKAFNKLPELDKKNILENDNCQHIGNSGDVYAVMNQRLHGCKS